MPHRQRISRHQRRTDGTDPTRKTTDTSLPRSLRCAPFLSCASSHHSRQRCRQLSSEPPTVQLSQAPTTVVPQLPTTIIVMLHSANTLAWGRLKCGRELDTVCSHCDTCWREDVSFLRYRGDFLVSYQNEPSSPLLFPFFLASLSAF